MRILLLSVALLAIASVTSAETVVVEMRSDDGVPSFMPAEVTIEPGDTVRWVNQDLSLEHSTCSGAGSTDPFFGDLWQSPLMRFGEYFEYTFDTAGEYEYFSIPHEYEGMLGLVLVVSGTDVHDGVQSLNWAYVKQLASGFLPRD